MLKPYLNKLMQQESLSRKEIAHAMQLILANNTNVAQTAAFLALLHAKGETCNELLGIIDTLRNNMKSINIKEKTLDIVGTGGDKANTINISTAAAILTASCGVKVAKHGNRAVSSQCGSADVLEQLGININLSPEQVAKCINEINIGFCFAPNFHPAMQQLRTIRKDLGIATSFNLLGPLLNPANTQYNLVGTYNKNIMQLLADIFLQLGVENTLVVHGNGLDELSCLGPIEAIHVTKTKQSKLLIDPKKLGFKLCSLKDLQGGDKEKNAKLLETALSGKEVNAITDTILLNAGVALWLYQQHDSLEQALNIVQEKLFSGEAFKLLNTWKEFSHTL